MLKLSFKGLETTDTSELEERDLSQRVLFGPLSFSLVVGRGRVARRPGQSACPGVNSCCYRGNWLAGWMLHELAGCGTLIG